MPAAAGFFRPQFAPLGNSLLQGANSRVWRELQRAGTPALSDDSAELPLDEMLASLQLSAINQWQAQRLQESIDGGAG